MEELLTTKELAHLLRLNEKKVHQLVKEGGIPPRADYGQVALSQRARHAED